MKKLLFLAMVTGGLSMVSGARAGDFGYAWNGYSRAGCDSRTAFVQPQSYRDDYGRYGHEALHQELREEHRNLHWDLKHSHQDLHHELRHERAYGVPEWQIRAEHREAHRDLNDMHHDGHADLRNDHRLGHAEQRW